MADEFVTKLVENYLHIFCRRYFFQALPRNEGKNFKKVIQDLEELNRSKQIESMSQPVKKVNNSVANNQKLFTC